MIDHTSSGAALFGVAFPGETPVAVPSEAAGQVVAAEITALRRAVCSPAPAPAASVTGWTGTAAEHASQLLADDWPDRYWTYTPASHAVHAATNSTEQQ